MPIEAVRVNDKNGIENMQVIDKFEADKCVTAVNEAIYANNGKCFIITAGISFNHWNKCRSYYVILMGLNFITTATNVSSDNKQWMESLIRRSLFAHHRNDQRTNRSAPQILLDWSRFDSPKLLVYERKYFKCSKFFILKIIIKSSFYCKTMFTYIFYIRDLCECVQYTGVARIIQLSDGCSWFMFDFFLKIIILIPRAYG